MIAHRQMDYSGRPGQAKDKTICIQIDPISKSEAVEGG